MTASRSLVFFLLVSPLAAQQPGIAPRVTDATRPAGDASPFRRLELPTPDTIRSGSGAPGPDYWQQRADYVIRASLDTVAQRVTGEQPITYTNNSPDTLRYLLAPAGPEPLYQPPPGLADLRPERAVWNGIWSMVQ